MDDSGVLDKPDDLDGGKARLSLRPAARLELGRTIDAGSVRQTFSHGRSQVVQVEVRKKRAGAPTPPALAAGAPSATPGNVAITARGNAPAVRPAPGAGRALTATELAARQRALVEQQRDSARREAERREQEKVSILTAAEEARRKAEEETQHQAGDNARLGLQVVPENSDDRSKSNNADPKVSNDRAHPISPGIKPLEADPWEGVAAKYLPGARYSGRVTNITDYGVFVELEPGVEGLVHVPEMSWTKKNVHPGKIVSTSQEVDVMVLDVDSGKRRISLGLKQVQRNPWEQFVDEHPIGSEVEGEIRRITEFGLFIGLSADIDGMIHMSDLSWDEPGGLAMAKYEKAQAVRAKVLDVDVERERISLGIKQLREDPAASVLGTVHKGDVVTCVVSAIQANGIEVKVNDVLTGFIRRAELARDKGDQRPDRFAVGEKVDAKIVTVDRAARKLTLTIKGKEGEEEKQAMAEFGASDSGASLGDILGAAIRRRNAQTAVAPASNSAEDLAGEPSAQMNLMPGFHGRPDSEPPDNVVTAPDFNAFGPVRGSERKESSGISQTDAEAREQLRLAQEARREAEQKAVRAAQERQAFEAGAAREHQACLLAEERARQEQHACRRAESEQAREHARRLQVEERARLEEAARMKAEADEARERRAREDAEERAKREAEGRLSAEAKARQIADERRKLEEQARRDEIARKGAEKKVRREENRISFISKTVRYDNPSTLGVRADDAHIPVVDNLGLVPIVQIDQIAAAKKDHLNPPSRNRIFLSYRRKDSEAITGRIYDRLATKFGGENVVYDQDSIPLGVDFRRFIRNIFDNCYVLLAVVGPDWTGTRVSGTPRIQDVTDPVRLEIEIALDIGIPTIPLLVGGTEMPSPDSLPQSIQDFPFLNAAYLSQGRDFGSHIERVIKELERIKN